MTLLCPFILLSLGCGGVQAFPYRLGVVAQAATTRPSSTLGGKRSRQSENDDTAGVGRPIDPSGWPMKFPAQEHCSRCGLCESSYVSNVKEACSFLPDGMMKAMDDDGWESRIHGRGRDKDQAITEQADELRFGVLAEPIYLARGRLKVDTNNGYPPPQWTGVVSSIAESMLEDGLVDAVVCIGTATTGSTLDWATPEPILARTVEDVRRGRGVKPSLAPTLRILDEIRTAQINSLLVCGVGCAVQAFRAVESQVRKENPLLQDIFVLGTNCADNSPTPQAAQNFIQRGIVGDSCTTVESIRGYEFMTDFKVHVKTEDGYLKKPYFCLPPSLAEPSIAPSCLACFDYTNALADVVVGYMGAPTAERMDQSWQTLSIRNDRGRKMVDAALQRLEIGGEAKGTGKHESFALSTVQSDSIVQSMCGKVVDPDKKGLPVWLGNIMARLLETVGPKGVSFARYSIDYHLLRNYLHVLAEWGLDGVDTRIPDYARKIVEKYRLYNDAFSTIEQEVIEQSTR